MPNITKRARRANDRRGDNASGRFVSLNEQEEEWIEVGQDSECEDEEEVQDEIMEPDFLDLNGTETSQERKTELANGTMHGRQQAHNK